MWRNWAGDQACEPALFEQPASTAEVIVAVERAVAAGRRVRVAGAGHSFTGAVLTEGSLLHLGRMTGVIDADRGSGLARVRAGTTIAALSDELAGHGLALENLGDIDVQAIAGAIATGTHGTGGRLPGLPAQVQALQLVTAAGEVVEIEAVEGSDPDSLHAAQVAVGSLGVVTELTLRCLPAYTLRGVDAPAPLEEVLDTLDEHVGGHRHFELFTFPHSPIALTRTNDVVDEAPRPRGKAKAYVDDVLVANRLFQAACLLGRAAPRAIPALNRTLSRAVGTVVRVDRSDRIFASPRLVRFVEMEYAVPRAAAADVLRAMKEQAERFAVGFPLELRFSAGDDTLLGPAAGRDSAFIAVHLYRGMAWEPFFRAAEAIADAHGGRPHWGKRHFQTAATLAPRYPGWEAFQAVRARLDPDGVFTNAYTDRVLGPSRPVSDSDGVPTADRGESMLERRS